MSEPDLVRSFCGTSRADVRERFAGPPAYICDERIGGSNDILADEQRAAFPSTAEVESEMSLALDAGWLERPVSGLVHRIAARNASGRVVVHADDLDDTSA